TVDPLEHDRDSRLRDLLVRCSGASVGAGDAVVKPRMTTLSGTVRLIQSMLFLPIAGYFRLPPTGSALPNVGKMSYDDIHCHTGPTMRPEPP
ncbi:MAG TPA: hypothetical protein VF156_03350, partial [Agromyces sp.]